MAWTRQDGNVTVSGACEQDFDCFPAGMGAESSHICELAAGRTSAGNSFYERSFPTSIDPPRRTVSPRLFV